MAIQSGNDVITFDRCRREAPEHQPSNPYTAQGRNFTRMTTQMYLQGSLTVGTRVFAEADGKKYIVSLPHGVFVKVAVNADLLNVWVVASPKDFAQTRGLCGNNDKNPDNDLEMRGGQILRPASLPTGVRPQPLDFCRDWRVDINSNGSILYGMADEHARAKRSLPAGGSERGFEEARFDSFCDCRLRRRKQTCGSTVDVSTCDMLQGSTFVFNFT